MLKLSKNEPELKEYFFALEINLDQIKSAIWAVEGNQVQILSLGETQSWQEEEELLDCVDLCLSSAVEKFSPQGKLKEPTKIIFGLSTDWVQENKILPKKAEILKEISQKLELTPLGFMVIPEAIVHWLKKLEGVPPTMILIGLSQRKIVVSLVELGKVVDSSLVIRSENLGADLAEGLSRLERQTAFSARILLYDGEEKLEEARQDLINWPWMEEKISFLHLPKVEILAPDFDLKAIVLASASQIAQSQDLDLQLKNEEKISSPSPLAETKEELAPITAKLQEELLGFIKGQDISQTGPKVIEEAEVVSPPESPVEENLGGKALKIVHFKWPKFSSGFFSWLRKFNLKKPFSFKKGAIGGEREASSRSKSSQILILVVVLLVLILGGLGAAYWFLPKAWITLSVKPQVLQKDFTVKLDPNLTLADKTNLTLPAKKMEITVEGEKETTTTGTKLVGEKAKGEVTIYNRTSKEKSFPEGTELIGPNNLKFTLDEAVNVASESAGSDYVKVPGKATVKVTASAIGSEGNLASGSEFTVGNYARSDFIARNESSLSGGTSREVQVVAKDDQEKILKALEEDLQPKALQELKNKLTAEEKLVEESAKTMVVEKNFDKKVDEEAEKLKLNLKLKVEALSFSESNFKQMIAEEIEKLVPSDFEYDSQQTEINLQLKESSGDTVTFLANFQANLRPKFALEDIKKNLGGKKLTLGKIYLGNLPSVESFEVKISPKLPEKIATFPHVAERMTIEIKLK